MSKVSKLVIACSLLALVLSFSGNAFAAQAPGWYVDFQNSITKQKVTFGPYSTESEAKAAIKFGNNVWKVLRGPYRIAPPPSPKPLPQPQPQPKPQPQPQPKPQPKQVQWVVEVQCKMPWEGPKAWKQYNGHRWVNTYAECKSIYDVWRVVFGDNSSTRRIILEPLKK